MSDQKFDDSVEQDLQDLAYGRAQEQKPPFSEEEQASQGQVPEQGDRSLSAIHTGNRTEHETASFSRDEGSQDNELNSDLDGRSQSQRTNFDFSVEEGVGGLEGTSVASVNHVVGENLADVRESVDASGPQTQQENIVLSEDGTRGSGIENVQVEPSVQEARIVGVDEVEDTQRQNLAPDEVSLDNDLIIENATIGELVGTVDARDDQGAKLTYSLADDADGKFSIDPSTGEIRVAGDLDYETATSHEIVVEVSDGTYVTEQTFTINVGDENEAPENLALDDNNIIENAAIGDVVGTVSATDQENNDLTYSLADDAYGKFSIDPATGEIRVAGDLDHEAAASHEIVVNVSDGTNVTEQTFTINVGDENEAPENLALDDNTIIENAAIGDVVGTVSAIDPESNSLTYSLADDAGGKFSIDPSTGEIRVAGDLDYEIATSNEIVAEVSDGTYVTEQTFTINVGDENEGPEAGNVDFGVTQEDTAFTFTQADLLANSSDVDGDNLSITMVSVDPAYGTVTEIAPGEYRFDPTTDFSGDDIPLHFTVSDGKFSSDARASLDVTAVSDAPELNVSISEPTIDVAGGNIQHATVNANSAFSSDNGFTVLGRVINEDGTLSEASAEHVEAGWSGLGEHGGDTPGYISVGGSNDGNNHLIGADEDSGLSEQLIIQLDGEATSADVGILHLMGSNGKGSQQEGFYTLMRDGEVVGSGNFIGESGGHEERYTLTADGNEPFDTIVFTAAEDFYGRTNGHSDYAITSIELDQTMPEVPVNVYDLEISAAQTDQDGSETLSGITIDNLPDGAVLSAGSQNEDGSWTVPLDQLDNLQLQVPTDSIGSTFDMTVSVTATDGSATPATTTLTLSADAYETAPEDLVLDNATIAENADIGDVVGVASATDLDGDTLTYSLVDDAGGKFQINAETGEITVADRLDFETSPTHDLVVEVTDGDTTISENFTVSVGDIAPGEMEGRGNTVDTQNVGEAIDLDHMDEFPDLYSPGNLEERIGTEVFEDMVADANDVYVNYQSDAQVTFQGEIAGYKNSVGGYQVDGDGNIVGVQLLWGDASDNKLEAGESTALYEGIDKGNQLGFFVIQNGFSSLPDCSYVDDGNSFPDEGQWVFVTSNFDASTDNPADFRFNVNEDTGTPKLIYVEENGTAHKINQNVYHSTNQDKLNPEGNVEDREHFVAGVDAENGILNFGFEDLYGGGDEDFNDGMFSVEIDVRDLVQVPNALFVEDGDGNSSFQIADADHADMQSLTLTMTNCLDGDQLNLSGGYQIVDGQLQLTDGTDLGLDASIIDSGATITLTIEGDGSAELYESIVQSINFFNPDQGVDISGVRDISVEGISAHGEEMDILSTTLTVGEDQVINGSADNETLIGGFGDDTLTGGGGDDTYAAGAGNDVVIGNDGADHMSGDEGHDSLAGGAGDDTLVGGDGDDQLHGGAGDDYLSGGDGADVFFFGMTDGMDTVVGGDGGGWSDVITLSDGAPDGEIGDWLTLATGQVEAVEDGQVFLSEDASGTINIGDDAVLTFEGIEKIEI